MIPIHLRNLTKRFGDVVALDDLSLEIRAGELFFLLGPSGCGKTTLLRSIAGFNGLDGGRIHFGDEEVTRVPPHARQTGMMFQSYALWPHLSVAQNVAFGLEERRVPRPELQHRVAEALATVHMSDHAQRKPNELSGGQQQRVALARALVVRPRCLLLDEPLSNLDARLRVQMRGEIRRIAKEHGLTTVYVTHDQKEALSIADRIAVLEAGRLLQVGTPTEIYRRPGSIAVATFIGETDLLPGRVTAVDGGAPQVETRIGTFRGVWGDPVAAAAVGTAITVSIRPECWRLQTEPATLNGVRARIGRATFLGELAQYELIAGEVVLKVLELNPRFVNAADATVHAWAQPEDVVVLTR